MTDPGPWFQQLKSAPRLVPSVLALSTARFLDSIDPEEVGSRFYLDEVVPIFVGALESPLATIPDPERCAEVLSCIDKLAELGEILHEDSKRFSRKFALDSRSDSPSRAKTDRGAVLSVPVVQDVVDNPRRPRSFLGFVAELRLYPRTVKGTGPVVRLLPGGRSVDVGDLEHLRTVAETAYEAAQSAGGRRVSGLSFLKRRTPVQRVFDLAIEEFAAPISGESAGLALAVGMLGALQGFERMNGRGFRPSIEFAWSGAVNESGSVLPVAHESLPAKVRAAFYHGLTGIVVSREQIAIAEISVPRSGRSFEVFGIDHINEVPQIPALIEAWAMPRSIRVAPEPPLALWERVVRTVIIPILILLAILALVNVRFGGKSYGLSSHPSHWILVVQRGVRPPVILHTNVNIPLHTVCGDLAGDPKDDDRLIVCTQFGPAGGANGDAVHSALRIYALSRIPFRPPRLLWDYRFAVSGLPYDPVREAPHIQYNPVKLWVGNLDDHSENEIVVATTAHPFAPVLFHLFAGLPYPAGAVAHRGNPAAAELRLLDLGPKRGKALVALLHANLVRGSALLALQRGDFYPVDRKSVRRFSKGGWDVVSKGTDAPLGETTREGPGSIAQTTAATIDQREFDLEYQPCLAYVTFPRHPAWQDLRVVDTMDLLDSAILPRGDNAPAIGFSFWCRDSIDKVGDYLVFFALPDTLLGFTSNAIMDNHADVLLQSGATRADLGSADFTRDWATMFRYYDHPVWNSENEGAPLSSP